MNFFLFFPLFFLLFSSSSSACSSSDRLALLSFLRSLNLNPDPDPNADCCRWDGISCTLHGRVASISLPRRALSATLHSSSLQNLTSLAYLNLSYNRLSGAFPLTPNSLRTLDLSSNRFNVSLSIPNLKPNLNLVALNVSNNSLSGPFPSSICRFFPRLQILDLTMNGFSGEVSPGLAACSALEIFRASLNSLSGMLPYDLHAIKSLTEISLSNNHFSGPINTSIVHLSNLTVLQLHVNQLTGEIPPDIGLLSNLEQLQLHTNSLNGSLPNSITNCSNLKTLLLRNNNLSGKIDSIDFSKLRLLEAIDLGNNTFVGSIPDSLCFCKSLTAVRLAYNQLVGEVPPCMSSLKPLQHFSLSDNFLSNVVGALKILRHCDNLAVLFLSRCFSNETMPDDKDLFNLSGFQNLQILTLGGCKLTGKIPSWISKLRKLKLLNLSYNNISGPIPAWIGDMPSLFVLNLTKNSLSGELPREIGRLHSLISDNSSSDLSYLALPFLFDTLQYNRLFNLPRGLKVGSNNLTGSIPEEIGKLRLLHTLDLDHNNFTGSIPDSLSNLVNLERLDMASNQLTGKIPRSLTQLSFLAMFSVADNDLEGEIPRGGQFDTFPATSFEGNPKLCGYLIRRNCGVSAEAPAVKGQAEEGSSRSSWFKNLPFGVGYLVGFLAVTVTLLLLNLSSWERTCGEADTSVETRPLWQSRQ